MREPAEGQLLLHVHACGVCRNDLHVLNGEARTRKLFVVPATRSSRPPKGTGQRGSACRGFAWTCGACRLPQRSRESLRPRALHRLDVDGDVADYALADERFCFAIPDG